MSYFPCDIPFMSDEELKENGINIPKDVPDTNVGNIEYVRRQYLLDEYDRQHQGPPGGARKIIKEAPAEDVVQVVHGRWKKIGEWGRVYRCNQCGNFLDFDGVNTGRGNANFCPNCGAKMDEEEWLWRLYQE